VIDIVLTFILAGIVKGTTGMGLPTVTMGVLGLFMAPAEAAALVIVPALITNVWQFASGLLMAQAWPMLLPMALVTWAAAGLMTGSHAANAATALGAVLMVYAAVGLARVRVAVSRRLERWLSPLVGAVTGVITGATGVFVIPAGPYFEALGLEKERLIQALGLSFSVSTLALAAGLACRGAFHLTTAGASLLCTVPALAGVVVGQWIRDKLNAETFRRLFFLGLLLLGADLVARSVF
jgi:uncharacterized membrane protein YfcA